MAPGMAKNECHIWRTTGSCVYGDKCKDTHIETLRGGRKKYGWSYFRERILILVANSEMNSAPMDAGSSRFDSHANTQKARPES